MTEIQQKILDFVAKNPTATYRAIGQAVGRDHKTVMYHMTRLVELGYVAPVVDRQKWEVVMRPSV